MIISTTLRTFPQALSCPVQGTSYCEIAQKVHSRKSDDAGVNHITPDVWENLWLPVSEAA